MKTSALTAAAGALALALAGGVARADIVNFDEFVSPPVTCCYSDTGVVGARTYANVLIKDGNDSGFVMNSDGWANKQTSGANLFGSQSGSIDFHFFGDASGLEFDIINGTGDATFTVLFRGAFGDTIGSADVSLTGFATDDSVGHISTGLSGIRSVHITGTDNFAVDTIRFAGDFDGGVPEPATWALMIGGFGMAGASLRRRRALAA